MTALIVLVLFLWLRVWVHHSSPDRTFPAFPDACPPSKQNGCNRVADSSPHNNRYDLLQRKLAGAQKTITVQIQSPSRLQRLKSSVEMID